MTKPTGDMRPFRSAQFPSAGLIYSLIIMRLKVRPLISNYETDLRLSASDAKPSRIKSPLVGSGTL